MELQNLMFALLGFSLALVGSFLAVPLFSFEMGLLTLCHYTLDICKSFSFYRGSQLRVCLGSQKRL
jgi:hypothetical protein